MALISSWRKKISYIWRSRIRRAQCWDIRRGCCQGSKDSVVLVRVTVCGSEVMTKRHVACGADVTRVHERVLNSNSHTLSHVVSFLFVISNCKHFLKTVSLFPFSHLFVSPFIASCSLPVWLIRFIVFLSCNPHLDRSILCITPSPAPLQL